VLEAFKYCGYALEFALIKLRADRGVVLEAVGQDICALAFASNVLTQDVTFIKQARAYDRAVRERLKLENGCLKLQINELANVEVVNVETNEVELEPVAKKPRLDGSFSTSSSSSSSAGSGLQVLYQQGARVVQVKKEYAERAREAERAAEESQGRFCCVLCLEADRECLYLPCSHLVTCAACGVELGEKTLCPVCQAPMVRRVSGVRLP